MTPATARESKLAAVCATVVLKNCSWRLRPPKKKHMPITSSRLDRMLPISDVWTMTTCFASRAATATINSTALLEAVS